MTRRPLARLALSALTAAGLVLTAQQLVHPAAAGGPAPRVALSAGPTHDDPLPPGVRWDDPTDTASLYERAGVDRKRLTRLTRVDRTDRLRRSTTTQRTAATAPPGTSIAPGLTAHVAPSCSGDGTDGKRVQAMYVRDAATASRYQDVLPLLLNEIANVDDVFAVSAQKTGGVRRVRWVHAGCVPVVPEVVVPAGALGSFDATIGALKDLGYRDPNRKYLAFTDASVLCGVGTYYADTRPVGNANDGRGASYSRVDTRCWSSRSTSVAAHELTHNLGGVLPGAPHVTANGHCWDESDLMCYSDGSGASMQTVCADRNHERLLDCNSDDYFSATPAPGSWLSAHWNTATSSFLDATAPVAAPVTPPVGQPVVPPTPGREAAPRRTKLRAGWVGRHREVRGTLRVTDGSRVSGATVRLERRYAGSSRWVRVGKAVTDRRGAVAERERPRRKAYYRWVFPGDDALKSSRSAKVRVRR